MECNWDGLLKKVQSAEDLDQVIAAHDTFLEHITSQCLLDTESQVCIYKMHMSIECTYMYIFSCVASGGSHFELPRDPGGSRTQDTLHVYTMCEQKLSYVSLTSFVDPLSLFLQPLLSLLRMIFDLIISFREKQADMLTSGLAEVDRRREWKEQNIIREQQVGLALLITCSTLFPHTCITKGR